VDPEQRDRLTGPLEHGQRVRTDLLPVKELLHIRDVLVRYRSKSYVLGNRVTSHRNHSRLPLAEVALAASAFARASRRATKRRYAARARFVSRCGFPISDWQPLGAVAYVTGVGFWDVPHGQTGHARNYSELHPVTALRFLAGCRA
jgi:hypothetical protein